MVIIFVEKVQALDNPQIQNTTQTGGIDPTKTANLVEDLMLSFPRVAEIVWMEGVFLKDYPPEAFTIRCLEDSQAFLQTEGGYQRFEEYLKTWMKKIQELLFDSEQLRRETDNLGPQVKSVFQKI